MKHLNFHWLVAREVWEHRGGFLWTPIAISVVFLVLLMVTGIWGSLEAGDIITQHAPAQKLSELMSMGYVTSALPLLVALPFVMVSYALGALYDERKNKSILFWKSLPISDTRVVMSKLATVLIALPTIFMVVAIVHSIAALTVITLSAAAAGISLWSVWGQIDTYLQLGRIVMIAAWMALASFPVACYLLAVGSWSNKPFLMAAIIPVMCAVVWMSLAFMFNFEAAIVLSWMKHMFLGMVPFVWETFNPWMYAVSAIIGTCLVIAAARIRQNTCS